MMTRLDPSVLELDYAAEADRIAKMIPDELDITLSKAIEKSAELRAECERNPIAKKIVEAGRVLRHPLRVGVKASLWLLTAAFPRWRSMLLVVGRKSAAASQ